MEETMPLSEAGKKLLKKFEQEYGEKKGKNVFYGKEHKDKKFARLVKHGKSKKGGR
jgi:hypothetical protein